MYGDQNYMSSLLQGRSAVNQDGRGRRYQGHWEISRRIYCAARWRKQCLLCSDTGLRTKRGLSSCSLSVLTTEQGNKRKQESAPVEDAFPRDLIRSARGILIRRKLPLCPNSRVEMHDNLMFWQLSVKCGHAPVLSRDSHIS